MNNWKKGIAKWKVGDTLYISVPFTWLVDEAQQIAGQHKGKVLMGGPGFMKPTMCEGFAPILFHNPCATYTTRGCPNRCPFCAVYLLEPEFYEIRDFRPGPVVCDNNFLAASRKHIEYSVDILKVYPLVDFNQGLEATRFSPEKADVLGKLRCKVRFAFDMWGQESALKQAVDLCRDRTTQNIGIYCLIGYKDTPDDAQARLELIRSWGIRPNPMRYQPLDLKVKNSFVDPNWTDYELRKMTEYYSRLVWYEHIPYGEFQYDMTKSQQLELIGK